MFKVGDIIRSELGAVYRLETIRDGGSSGSGKCLYCLDVYQIPVTVGQRVPLRELNSSYWSLDTSFLGWALGTLAEEEARNAFD